MKPENALPKAAPHIMPLWDHTRNIGINPWNISKWDKNEVYWHCDKCGMSWEEKPINMHQAKGCYYCNGERPIPGKTDLATLEPNLIKEWDYEKNGVIDPTKLTRASSKKVWWKCLKEGHSWQANIYDRACRHRGCPYCSGRRIIQGKTDFATLNPILVKEWDWEKNDALGIKPDQIAKSSHTNVWWKCARGHSWQAPVNRRTINNAGCPYCVGASTSYPEQYIYWSLKQIYPRIINRYKTSNNVEYDIAIPEVRLLIEYNGAHWHKNKNSRDLMKEQLAKENGLTFISIVGDEDNKEGLKVNGNNIVFNPITDIDNQLQKIIQLILLMLRVKADIDFNYSKSQALHYSKGLVKYEDSLVAKFPHIAAEWDYSGNNGMTPADFYPYSTYRASWKCGLGHTWQTKIQNRTSLNSMCPTCQAMHKARNSPLK